SAKAVDYETEVVLGNGERKKIGEIVERAIEEAEKNGKLGRVDDGFYAPIDIEVYSLDLETLKVRKARANIAWKRTAPKKMMLVKTRGGKRIRVTPTHPFFVLEEGKVAMRKARDLEEGNKIATIEGLSVSWDEVAEILEYEPKDPWVYDLQVPGYHNFLANGIFVHAA
uniref:Cell division control protein n=1 Tax=Pyrococcus abyssi (strain GE5 / Orsay) TaxID=272844 RepID=UPI0011B93439|nr:Chain A, Cell division control protein [Pyrococcus abyssi GE5]